MSFLKKKENCTTLDRPIPTRDSIPINEDMNNNVLWALKAFHSKNNYIL
jgi:hypothetical protein